MSAAALDNVSPENPVYAKVTWRLVPFLFLCYVLAYLDRVNVGFAKLQMASELKFSETVYGLGAGIFFIGYFLFEVPSNVILHRVGARVWIARIMITWGVLSSAMMLVSSPTGFYVLRFLLGLAEAGFFPGIILYITYWYPSERRGHITALFMTAIAVAGVVGGPLSGWLLKEFGGTAGLSAWQWLFVVEGVPSVLVGILVLFYLDDSIGGAKWLDAGEKRLLSENIARDNAAKSDHHVWDGLRNPKVYLFAAIYFCFVAGLYGIGFWLPTIIKAMGVKDPLDIGLLSAIPWAVGAVGMVLVGRRADRQRERRWHVAIPALLGAVGLALSVQFGESTTLAMAALSLATFGILTTLPLFWSLPTAIFGSAAAASGIALVNSFGNLAGFVSPFAIGWIKDATQSTANGMYLLAASLVLGAVLVLAGVRSEQVNR